LRNCFCESQQTPELLLLSFLYVLIMVDILPAPGSVLADRLQHSTGRSINGDFRPTGWDYESCDSSEIVATYLTAVGGYITEALFCSKSFDTSFLKSLNLCS
jgi:hypothetical protein